MELNLDKPSVATLALEHHCKLSLFPLGISVLFFAWKPPLMNLEYFGLRWVVTLGLHFTSVNCDLSYFLEKEKKISAWGQSKWKILCTLHSNMCYSHNCWLQTFNPNGLEQSLSIQLSCRYPLRCFPTPIMCFPGCWPHFQPTSLSLITFLQWMNETFISQSSCAACFLGFFFCFFFPNNWWQRMKYPMQFVKITYMPITTFLRAGAVYKWFSHR